MSLLNAPGPGIGPLARLYRGAWWVSAGTGTALGAVVAVVSVPRPLLIFLVAAILAVAGTVEGAIQSAVFGKFQLARVLILILVTVPVAMAIVGWAALIGGWALLLTAVVGLSQPDLGGYLLRGVRRILGRVHFVFFESLADRRSASTEPPPLYRYTAPVTRPASVPDRNVTRLLSTAVPALSDGDLCYAWRVSFLALQRLADQQNTLAQSRVVELRQLYLDEMERRNPQGFSRWLKAGARPASDPTRYLLRSSSTGQGAAPPASAAGSLEA